MKIETSTVKPAFQPVSVTLTFTSAEELNAFTDFLVASRGTKVRAALEKKLTRRLPKMPEHMVWLAVVRPLSAALQKLTVKPTPKPA